MKKLITLLITCGIIAQANAAIIRCNNNPLVTAPNVYATAGEAINFASPGDTIHFEPSALPYDNFVVEKPVVILSTGSFLSLYTGLQANPLQVILGDVSFYPGSENSIISCKANSIYLNTNNITIQNSCINNIYPQVNPTNNISIKQSVISLICGPGCIGGSWNNLILENCYIGQIYNNTPSLTSSIINQCIIANSVFGIENAVITNSIFFTNTSFDNCNAHNNICAGLMSGNFTGTNNIPNVDMTTVLAQWPNFQGDDYQLLPSYSNQTIGMYAGVTPYKPGGIPTIPSIYQLEIPENTSNMDTLQIQISTKSNN